MTHPTDLRLPMSRLSSRYRSAARYHKKRASGGGVQVDVFLKKLQIKRECERHELLREWIESMSYQRYQC